MLSANLESLFKTTGKICVMITSLFLLSGCLYPASELKQTQIPNDNLVATVQTAVDKYQENLGILPIKTKVMETPYYQKYIIDFKELIPRYLTESPANAYENGGVFQYTLIDVEENPTVKLIDIVMANKIMETKRIIKLGGYPAFKEKLAEDVFTLNYEKMGFKEEPTVRSPYSGEQLHLVMSGQGELYVDYTPDLFTILAKNKRELLPGQDIRFLLTENSLFVPAFSKPYTIDETAKIPVFLSDEE